MNFTEQSAAYIEGLTKRRSKPAKQATLDAYGSYLRTWILPAIGNQDLETFTNGPMKKFVEPLVAAGLGAKTVREIVTLVKQIIKSAVTEDGDFLYPRVWNNKFLDLPPIEKQKQPVVTPEQLKKAIKSEHGLFFALLAGTGLRIGEALAVRWGDTPGVTSLDALKPLIYVRSSLYQRQEQPPKTVGAIREVDLDPRLWHLLCQHTTSVAGEFLFQNRNGGALWQASLNTYCLKGLGISGFHGFRRYRITRLRELGVPEDIIRYWVGHAVKGITDRYSKLAENRELRAGWSKRAGLGFDLPKEKD
jgi:integrase